MQRQTLVAEACLPSGKQGDRGPEKPIASTSHIDVGATSPRKDPKQFSPRGSPDYQHSEADTLNQRACNKTVA